MFNNYFNSIVKELNISIDQNLLNDASLFDDPIIAAVHKYERHPSILKVKEKLKIHDLFSFYHFNPDKVSKIIENVDSKKATQQGDVPVGIIKEKKSLSQKFHPKYLTFTSTITLFLMDLRMLILSLFIRKMILLIKLIIHPLVFYLFYLNLLNAANMIKFMNMLILYYQKSNVAFENVSVRNIH